MPEKSLGSILKDCRERRNLTLEKASELVGISTNWLSSLESDEAPPAHLDLLLRLYDVLVLETERDREILAVWLFKWFGPKLERDEHRKNAKPVTQQTHQQIVDIIEQLAKQPKEGSALWEPGQPRTLANFPDHFLPSLTVIVGDRRRANSPINSGDVFVESAAITDLIYLPQLKLPKECRVRSDRMFAVMSQDQLKHELGETNLLILGSPIANLASRALNDCCLFRFATHPDVRVMESKLRELNFSDHERFRAFWKIAESTQRSDLRDYLSQKLQAKDLEEIKDQVMKIFGIMTPSQHISKFVGEEQDIVNPTDTMWRYNRNNDYAIISLGINPYASSNEYVTIMAAGLGALGTAQAVRTLAVAPQTSFAQHPFGGILEVSSSPTPTRTDFFDDATSKWVDPSGYAPRTALANLEVALKETPQGSSLKHLKHDEIDQCRKFVLGLLGNN